MFETEVFWKQTHCIEESTCDIVGTFWHSAPHAVIWYPHSDSEDRELRPLRPRYAPASGPAPGIGPALEKINIFSSIISDRLRYIEVMIM